MVLAGTHKPTNPHACKLFLLISYAIFTQRITQNGIVQEKRQGMAR
ncbi:hypothetical protein PT7_P028 (plasmid) [Pusillimonas sp. T7-7]|nr:hypothetical protein PT7_P028 [Pusillimonas sp. T7-7]